MLEERGSIIRNKCLIQEENSNKIWESLYTIYIRKHKHGAVSTIQKTLEKAKYYQFTTMRYKKHLHAQHIRNLTQRQVKLLGALFTQVIYMHSVHISLMTLKESQTL